MISYMGVKNKMFKKNPLLWVVIISLIITCLIMLGFTSSVFKQNSKKTVMTGSQEQNVQNKSTILNNQFDTNYKLEVKNIKKADDKFVPGMDELWITYSDGTKKKLISPVPFGSQASYKENAVTDIENLTISLDKTKIFFASSLGQDCATIYKFDLRTNTLKSICFGELYGIVTEGKYKGNLKVYERFPGTSENPEFIRKYVLLDDSGKQIGTWTPDNNSTN
jgi:hypothetical protein